MSGPTVTFCGICGHPMHWQKCGVRAETAPGPCGCRNDVSYHRSEPLTELVSVPSPWTEERVTRLLLLLAQIEEHTRRTNIVVGKR